MIAQIHFATERFLAMFRERIRDAIPIIREQVTDGTEVRFIDRIDVLPATRLDVQRNRRDVRVSGRGVTENLGAPQIQIWQPLDIHTVLLDDVLAAGANPVAAPRSVELVLVFDVRVETSLISVDLGGFLGKPVPATYSVALNFTYAGALAPPALEKFLKARLGGVAIAIPVPLGFLSQILDYTPELHNAGLGVNGDNSVLVIRLEAGNLPPYFISDWQSFYDKDATDTDPAYDWRVVLDHRIFVAPIESNIWDGVDKEGSLHITHSPSGSLSPIAGGTRLTVKFKADVKKADVNAEVTITIDMTVKDGEVRLHIRATHDLDDWDVAWAGLKGAFLAGFSGMVIGGVFGGPVGALIGGISGAVLGFAAVIVIASLYPSTIPDEALKKSWKCEIPDGREDERVCTYPLKPAIPGTVGAKLLSIDPVGSCGAVSGSLTIPATGGGILELTTPLDPFDWVPTGTKDASGAWLIQLQTSIQLKNVGTGIIRIGQAEGYGKWSPVLSVTVPSSFGKTAYMTVTAEPPNSFFDEPGACQVVLRTSGGMRIVELAVPPRPSNEEIDRLMEMLKRTKEKASRFPPGWHKISTTSFDPGWELPFRRQPADLTEIDIRVTGAANTDRISLVDAAGVAWASGLGSSPTLLLHARAEPEMAGNFMLERSGGPTPDSSHMRLQYREKAWLRHAETWLPEPSRASAVSFLRSVPVLATGGALGLALLDVSRGATPVTVASLALPGTQALLAWRDGFLVGGQQGLWQWQPQLNGRDDNLTQLLDGSVSALVNHQGVVHALRNGQLQALEGDLTRVRQINGGAGAFALAVSGSRLILQNGEGLEIREGVGDHQRVVGFYPRQCINSLLGLPENQLLVGVENGGAEILDLDRLQVAVESRDADWQANTLQFGGYLLRFEQDRTMLSIYTLLGSYASPRPDAWLETRYRAAQVDDVVPSGDARVLSPPERILVHFDKRLRVESAGPGSVRLVGPNGEDEVIREWVLSEDRRAITLELQNDLQPGLYQIVVDGTGNAGVRDIHDLPVDGDRDGQPGGNFTSRFEVIGQA
jgi:hypothetical protein